MPSPSTSSPARQSATLSKAERIHSRSLIDVLFAGGRSRSMVAFPLRAVFLVKDRENLEPQVQMLISVPKRNIRHAVGRNRVKRQVREAFRIGKQVLLRKLLDKDMFDKTIAIAFIWLDNSPHATDEVERKVRNLLTRISEKI